jgi:hypothetical protein
MGLLIHSASKQFFSQHTLRNVSFLLSSQLQTFSLNMDIADLLPRSNDEKFLGFRDSERLEKLKTIIIQLYKENYGLGGKRMTLRQITEFMRDKYAFHIASVVDLFDKIRSVDVT